MDYYNSMPSGPSSRPYDPQSFSNPSGQSTTQSSLSPSFPSYPMMTDLPPPTTTTNTTYDQPLEPEEEEDQEQRSVIEVDNSAPLVEPHQDLDSFLETFWTRQMAVVERDNPDFRTYPLPLARIKKVMKSDEEVKMISAEVPIMFSKACEVFISELTCRAWLIAESNKRRTLQKADVANAIAHSDMFDFLIDIVPRDDGTAGSANGGGSGGGGDAGSANGTAMVEGEFAGHVDDQSQGQGQGLGQDEQAVQEVERLDQTEQDEEDRVFTEFVRDDED